MANTPFFSRLFGAAKPTEQKASTYPIPFGAQSYVTQVGKPVWMKRDYGKFAEEAYSKNVIAHRAIDMIASGAASVKFRLTATDSEGKETALRQHGLLDMLRKPNPTQSGHELLEALYAHLLISGNAYLHAIGPEGSTPRELHVLRPDRVQVVAGRGGVPEAYLHKVGDVVSKIAVDGYSGHSRLLHLKQFHPLDDWYGLSAIEAAAYSIDQHNQAGAWNQALLQNGARPTGALVVNARELAGGQLSQEQYERLRQQVDSQFSGAANAGRPLLLEGGLEWREMSLSPKDMDFIDAKHSAARDIALAFGVPPQLLGIPGDNTYSNLAEARLALWEQTILPLVSKLLDGLNGWAAPMFGEGFTLKADSDSIPALAPKRDKEWERISMADFLTDDEKRELLGLGK